MEAVPRFLVAFGPLPLAVAAPAPQFVGVAPSAASAQLHNGHTPWPRKVGGH